MKVVEKTVKWLLQMLALFEEWPDHTILQLIPHDSSQKFSDCSYHILTLPKGESRSQWLCPGSSE